MFPLLLLLAAAQPDHGTRVNVGVFQFSGPLGAELREQTSLALDDTFDVQLFALDHAAVLDRTGCEALDQACMQRLRGWLSGDARTAVTYAVIEVRGSPSRSILICDLQEGVVIDALRFRDDTGDMILPLVVPGRIARVIREHHDPPPPITNAEEMELAQLDEAPIPYEELRLCACLSVGGPYNEPPNCRYPGETRALSPSARCAVQPGSRPSPLFVLLALLALRVRRNALIERLGRSGRLPHDVVARLSALARRSVPPSTATRQADDTPTRPTEA